MQKFPKKTAILKAIAPSQKVRVLVQNGHPEQQMLHKIYLMFYLYWIF